MSSQRLKVLIPILLASAIFGSACQKAPLDKFSESIQKSHPVEKKKILQANFFKPATDQVVFHVAWGEGLEIPLSATIPDFPEEKVGINFISNLKNMSSEVDISFDEQTKILKVFAKKEFGHQWEQPRQNKIIYALSTTTFETPVRTTREIHFVTYHKAPPFLDDSFFVKISKPEVTFNGNGLAGDLGNELENPPLALELWVQQDKFFTFEYEAIQWKILAPQNQHNLRSYLSITKPSNFASPKVSEDGKFKIYPFHLEMEPFHFQEDLSSLIKLQASVGTLNTKLSSVLVNFKRAQQWTHVLHSFRPSLIPEGSKMCTKQVNPQCLTMDMDYHPGDVRSDTFFVADNSGFSKVSIEGFQEICKSLPGVQQCNCSPQDSRGGSLLCSWTIQPKLGAGKIWDKIFKIKVLTQDEEDPSRKSQRNYEIRIILTEGGQS